jgi:CcmD family protein
MVTFITAYAIVWLALVVYAVRLRANQRHLERIVRALAPDRGESQTWPDAGPGA